MLRVIFLPKLLSLRGRSVWKRITIANEKRKYQNPIVYESQVPLREYDGEVRQIIMRGNGREGGANLPDVAAKGAQPHFVGCYLATTASKDPLA
jgi:hypothetical protein